MSVRHITYGRKRDTRAASCSLVISTYRLFLIVSGTRFPPKHGPLELERRSTLVHELLAHRGFHLAPPASPCRETDVAKYPNAPADYKQAIGEVVGRRVDCSQCGFAHAVHKVALHTNNNRLPIAQQSGALDSVLKTCATTTH